MILIFKNNIMEFNMYALIAASFCTLIIGAIWYNPKVFGRLWMHASGLTEDKLRGGNIFVTFLLVLIFGFFMAFILQFLVIHQFGVFGAIGGDPLVAKPSYQAFMDDYGTTFRTFKHGALHGFMTGLLFTFSLIVINALFERKSWKYILINSGYWLITLTIMGGIICGWYKANLFYFS